MDIKKIWKNKFKIIEGFWNKTFPNKYVKRIADKRRNLCTSNICGFYDELGEKPNVYLKGKPACSGCGCEREAKIHSLSSWCYLKDLGLTPLWDAEMSQKEEDNFRSKIDIKNK